MTDFSGHLTRVTYNLKAESSHLKIETDDELTTITFCSKIRGFDDRPKESLSEIKICGSQLCWISEESESITAMNMKDLEKVEQKDKDADGYFSYKPFVKKINLKDELGFNEKVRLECCSPLYALHVRQKKYLDDTEIEKCTQFLKVYSESKVMVIDLSQENLPVIKEVSELK